MARLNSKSKFWRNYGFFFKWAALFAVGVAGLESNVTAFKIFGMFIVAPSLITVALLIYGTILYKIVERLGGDPKEGWFAIVTFISFCILFGLYATWADHHHVKFF